MIENTNTYKPDYAIPPGWVLEEYLEAQHLTQVDFSRRCGISPKHVSEIISGHAPITSKTALIFERVLGLKAYIWMRTESEYRLFIEEGKQQKSLKTHIDWAKKFPLTQLRKMGIVEDKRVCPNTVDNLLRFLGVASVEAWAEKIFYQKVELSFKKQDGFELSPEALSIWLRLSDNCAEEQRCSPYSKLKFEENLTKIRDMTTWPANKFYKEMVQLCNEAGVSLCTLESFPKLPISGTARWVAKDKAAITLSLRFGTNDHFWFSFFHEAAHILLHHKKTTYIDIEKTSGVDSAEEMEANQWARDFLIPKREYQKFIKNYKFTKQSIQGFARDINIHPGIIVGRLTHEGLLNYGVLQNLKRKFVLGQS